MDIKKKMIYKYFKFGLSITVISFLVGMVVNSFLKKTALYKLKLSNLNFIRNEDWNKWIGLDLVKWVILNTPIKYLNQKLRAGSRADLAGLQKLREEMTSSEIDHLIGFGFVSIFAIVKCYNKDFLFGLCIMLVNMLMNLYPSLLQQQNKRRIDRLIRKIL